MSGSNGVLIVAPYLGEFGWELMNWQGRVRWEIAHGGYHRVVICAEPDRRALYRQPHYQGQVVFHAVSRLSAPGHRNEDHRVDERNRPVPPAELRRLVLTQASEWCKTLGMSLDEASVLMPDFKGTIWPTTPSHQILTSLRVRQPVATDVVLAPRVRRLGQERNRPDSWWEELAERLRSRGLLVETYAPRVDQAIQQLSRARLAVGASTGGMHLASLCGCPHYVWGSGQDVVWTSLAITNRQRYETVWNPLGTPCRYDECGWQPPMERVLDQTLDALGKIGLRRGWRTPAWSLKPKWRVKRGFARLLEHGDHAGVWPWRLRQAVRRYVV